MINLSSDYKFGDELELVTLSVPSFQEAMWKALFEVEIMQGERSIGEDGNVVFKFHCAREKAEDLRRAVLKAFFHYEQITSNQN